MEWEESLVASAGTNCDRMKYELASMKDKRKRQLKKFVETGKCGKKFVLWLNKRPALAQMIELILSQ